MQRALEITVTADRMMAQADQALRSADRAG
jgi:hypothetical protein